MRNILITAVLGFLLNTSRADDRIWFPYDVKINGQTVKLVLDTGSDNMALFSQATKRLGLKFTNVSSNNRFPDQISYGITEPCIVTVSSFAMRARLMVLDIPDYDFPASKVDRFDGLIGWQSISTNVFQIDADVGTMWFVKHVPDETNGWLKFRISTNDDTLELEVPGQNHERLIIGIDTGADGGIQLSPQEWKKWKAAHPNTPMTVEGYFSPTVGDVVSEESWATELAIGPLVLKNTLVSKDATGPVGMGLPGYKACLGLAALKCMDFIVDGKHGFVYLRPKNILPPYYKYNQLGAVFVPRDLQSDDLVAHVVEGTPAYEAGIRNGDVLLKRDGVDRTKWRTDSKLWDEKSLDDYPAGTKFDLILRRGTNIFKITVVLRDYLSPQ